MTQLVYCVHKVHKLSCDVVFEELMALYAREENANDDARQRHALDNGEYIVLARVVRGERG